MLTNHIINPNWIYEVQPEAVLWLLGRKQELVPLEEAGEHLRGKRVMVTGASGSIGSELSRQIVQCHPKEIVLVSHGAALLDDFHGELLSIAPPKTKVTVIDVEIRDENEVREAVSRELDYIFHLAALKFVNFAEDLPECAIKTNVLGTQLLVDAAEEFNVPNLTLVSSDKAVNPKNVYGATKKLGELIIQAKALSNGATKFRAVRFANVLGSRGSVFCKFQERLAAGGPVTVTHPQVARYFMSIPEAVSLLITASAMGGNGEIFILKHLGDPIKIVDLADTMIALSGKDIEIKFTELPPEQKLVEKLMTEAEEKLAKTTKNERILEIPQETGIDAAWLLAGIKELVRLADKMARQEIISKLQELVPTYNPAV